MGAVERVLTIEDHLTPSLSPSHLAVCHQCDVERG
jgi:hypothetical protein